MQKLTKDERICFVEKKLLERTNEIMSWPEWKQNAISYSVNYSITDNEKQNAKETSAAACVIDCK